MGQRQGWAQRHGLRSSNRLKQTVANIKPGPVQRQVVGSRFSHSHVDLLPFLPTTSHAAATAASHPSSSYSSSSHQAAPPRAPAGSWH